MPFKENGSVSVSNTGINYDEDCFATEKAGEIEVPTEKAGEIEDNTQQYTGSYEMQKSHRMAIIYAYVNIFNCPHISTWDGKQGFVTKLRNHLK